MAKKSKDKLNPDIINVDDFFTYVGEDQNKKKSLKRFDLTRKFGRKQVAGALAVMIAVTAGLGGYTVVKVDANIDGYKKDVSASETTFAEEGVDAFTDSESIVEASGNDLMKTVSAAAKEQSNEIGREKRVADFLNALDSLADRIIANNFWYSNSNNSKTYEGALKKRKVTNCALYVSWACQEAGLIPYGKTFWCNTRIHGALGALQASPYLEISYPRCKVSQLDLQPGDILGWTQHTTVYAGKDANGNNLWYSAGGDGGHKSGGKCWFDNSMRPKVRHFYDNHRVEILIRIK